MKTKMLRALVLIPAVFFCGAQDEPAQMHDHGIPEKLGKVHFSTSCAPAVQDQFDRGVALLHSFAYTAAESTFKEAAERDTHCAMAHWGIAMTYCHQLWEPPIASSSIAQGQEEIRKASQMPAVSERERGFIAALQALYKGAPSVPYRARVLHYEQAMKQVASSNSSDMEAQVFYALALLASASPEDKTHAKQKAAAQILVPLFRSAPQHPGILHYLIHAFDNAELASQGVEAARAYSQIAPSAPHALHMPSHIFTRLGLWEDSIAANLASREAAHRQGDVGEELHAMDYLVYAYLQISSDTRALQIIQDLQGIKNMNVGDFKIGYAATVMPIRYAAERRQWAEMATIEPLSGAPLHVKAISVWARGLGLARTKQVAAVRKETDSLQQIERQLEASGNEYWTTQTRILERELTAWSMQAANKPDEAASLLSEAADQEDSIEKLPVTPGPIIPAREQLGDLLLEQKRPDLALKEFNRALASSPGRRGALQGKENAQGSLLRRGSSGVPISPND